MKIRIPSALALSLIAAASLQAQAVNNDSAATSAPPPSDVPVVVSQTTAPSNSDIVRMSPFEVQSTRDRGYTADTTLAGNRLNTELRDIGSSVSVVTSQFMKDVGATSNTSLLQYTVSSEVGGVKGNFAGLGNGTYLDPTTKFTQPDNNTRIRGLAAADNSRGYFLTNIMWDAYNVDGVDLQRGANSILFGMGSPAGLLNTRLREPMWKNDYSAAVTVGSYGSVRGTIDLNQQIVPGQLAVRVDGLLDNQKYKQTPAFQNQKRLYGALRWEPKLFKSDVARTIIKANYEVGNITSNQPRDIPPYDNITPWYSNQGGNVTHVVTDSAGQPVIDPKTGLVETWTTPYAAFNKATYVPANAQDNSGLTPGNGAAVTGGFLGNGNVNPYYNPWLGNFAQQFGGPLAFYNGNSSANPAYLLASEPQGHANTISPGTDVLPYMRLGSVASYSQYALNANLPYSAFGLYKNKSLTDPSIFDFYNNLLDGPNKNEWQKFRNYNVSLAQTFFRDSIGVEAAYNKEWSNTGQVSYLYGDHQAIYVDTNSNLTTGTPQGANGVSFADAPNPNVGRPFVSSDGMYGNNSSVTNRESWRVTGFAKYDFTEHSRSKWAEILGSHTITGMASGENYDNDFRQWQLYAITDPAYQNLVGAPNINNNLLLPNTVTYLGNSVAGRSSAAGANIPNPSTTQVIPGNAIIRAFVPTWTAGSSVDPSAVWNNPFYPAGSGMNVSTQGMNPANFQGWTNLSVPIISSEANGGANRNALTDQANLNRYRLKSQVFVWQGKFWDDSIVGMWSVRKDEFKTWGLSNGGVGSDYTLANPNTVHDSLTATSHAYSIMVHISDLPFLTQWTKKLPVDLSVYYNNSQNFQPGGVRVDIYGNPLPAPSGKTIDRGILLETKDRKYSLKFTKFATNSQNVGVPELQNYVWFIGLGQAWANDAVNRYEAFLQGKIDPNNGSIGKYYYSPLNSQTDADALAQQQNVVNAWRKWQASVNPAFWKAWNIDPTLRYDPNNESATGNTERQPNGLAITADSTSSGYELEFNANPTKNWRISLNASKIDASYSNVGGAALTDFINSYIKALAGGAAGSAGDVRIWWGSPGGETTFTGFMSRFYSAYAQLMLNQGADVPELRKYHVNLITNYTFDHGAIKGLRVGGGVRYASGIILGYPPVGDPYGQSISFDLSKPYKGPSETNFDFWIGYNHNLTKGINWDIQLNVTNVFVGNQLIPISVQADGSPAAYRIRPAQVIQLTNTFHF